MNRPIIEAEGLGKTYQLGAIGPARVQDAFAAWWRRRRGLEVRNDQEFHALTDVSFAIPSGRITGIIGRNGAGKSTLLKILSRITEPTHGRAVMRGRVASLLEVGTGFHPDLTGRENVFLNGAILGMTRREIRAKFDEIVAFSEVEKFIDTPVKRYSSGMYVRLAFAVAAHLEPEILIVDEVLAVGDAQFQKKCLGKMRDVGSGGRTVLFVSHDLAAVSSLCQEVLYLVGGRVRSHGPTHEVLAEYAAKSDVLSGECDLAHANVPRRGSGAARFVVARLRAPSGRPLATATQGEPFEMELEIEAREDMPVRAIGVSLGDPWGNDLFTSFHYDTLELGRLAAGRHRLVVAFDPNFLARGSFVVRLSLLGPQAAEYDVIPSAFALLVAASPADADVGVARAGTVRLPLPWRLAPVGS
ncbi:MAG TPA: ABC transporter ATP-binding protein [Opitutaceae bacterium]|jgi:lipopolysaccharide transport system ATP-binding protein|nr:ABC transporter ATP-binding protein [Opitutaceae bacterium]